MPFPYPYSRLNQSPEQYLSRLLCAILAKHGGEISLTAREILSISPDACLAKSVDLRHERIVLRFSAAATEQFAVGDSGGEQWPSVPKRELRKNPEELKRAPASVIPQQRNIRERLEPVEPPPGYRIATPTEAATLESILQASDQPKTRHRVLDDLSAWLTEQEKISDTAQTVEEAERQLNNRSAPYPWTTRPSPR